MAETGKSMVRLLPEAVARAFVHSGKKHLFFTGTRGVGKSTMLSRVVPLLTEKQMGEIPGIITKAYRGQRVTIRENGTSREVNIGIFDETYMKEHQGMKPVEEGFTGFGVPLLEKIKDGKDPWVVLDELGYLESACVKFQDAVKSTLEEKRVIGVLRKQSIPFLDEIASRGDVFLYDLDQPVKPIGCIVMASGFGRRFGKNKLLESIQGKKMIEHVLDKTGDGLFPERVVVTRYPEIQRICETYGVPVIIHDLPYRSDTVRLGLQTLGELEGYLFIPSDQPLLTRESLESLCLAFSQGVPGIYRTGFQEKMGAPVIFDKKYKEELLTLPEGKGGSFVIRKHIDQLNTISVLREEELWDIDTPDDLERIKKSVSPEVRDTDVRS